MNTSLFLLLLFAPLRPCIVTFIPPADVFRWILPIAMVAWALAMTVFRSPAMGYAPP